MARIGPERAFLLFFGVFTHFLALKYVKSNEREGNDELKRLFTFPLIIRKY